MKTSGAFHTNLMDPARQRLVEALNGCADQLRPTTVDVYMNVTGKKVPVGTEPSVLIPLMSEQLCNCVLWEPCVRAMLADGITEYYECGPMKQLTAMMKRIDTNAWK